MRQHVRSVLIIALTAIAAVTVYVVLPGDMNELSRRTAAVFVVAAVFWATEVMPLYATALCVLAFEVLFLADQGGLARLLPAQSDWPMNDAGEAIQLQADTFFEPFASPIIILFMGGFLLAAAVNKHGIDRAIASRLLSPFTDRPLRLMFAVAGITAFFSMWMSNTATTAMMMTIIAPLLRQLPDEQPFARALVLAVPFGANIGGIGTPIGTPPNAVALAALRMNGFDIGFPGWMLLGVPLAVALLVVAILLLYWFYKPDASLQLERVERATQITLPGKLTLVVLVLAIILWLTQALHGLSSAVVALLAAAALTAFRVLDRTNIDSIDWNILILMWGGLSLGHAMEVTGLVDYIVNLPIADLGGFALAAAVVVLAAGLSTFMSNTAAASLIIPMAMAISPAEQGELAILTAFACSFAMAMPVSTPPNAIAFASGRIPARALLKTGGLVTLLAILALLAGYQVMIPLILGIGG